MAAKSPVRAMAGPEVVRMEAPNSLATTVASVVLPSPGGPENRIWSAGSPRPWAARDHDAEGLLHLRLAQVIVEPLGTQGEIELQVVLGERRGHRAVAPERRMPRPALPRRPARPRTPCPSMSRSNAMISYRLPKRFKAYCSSAPSPASSGAPRKATSASAEVKPMERSASVAPCTARLRAGSTSPWLNSDAMPPSKVPFSSKMMRSAVFFPTPGIWDTRAMSWEAMASASSAGENVESAARAIFGPTFDTPMSFSNSALSSLGEKAEQRDAVLRHGQVGEHAGFLAHGQLAQVAPRHGHGVAHAGDIDGRAVCGRQHRRHGSVQKRNHANLPFSWVV